MSIMLPDYNNAMIECLPKYEWKSYSLLFFGTRLIRHLKLYLSYMSVVSIIERETPFPLQGPHHRALLAQSGILGYWSFFWDIGILPL